MHIKAILTLLATLLLCQDPQEHKLPVVEKVEAQPLIAQAKRIVEALDYLGRPLPDSVKEAIRKASKEEDGKKAVRAIQEALDPYCLIGVNINPESRVKVKQGPAKPVLVEAGWRQFLIKVHNEAGVTARLRAYSPNARPLHNSPKDSVRSRWLGLQTFDRQPLRPRLSGLEVEYRLIQLYSRDAGKREAKLVFDVGQGTQDLGFRNEINLLFTCTATAKITLSVKDENGKPTTARFIIRDKQGRIYPSQAKRLAPDFAFHPQVYRADGESVKLPKGEYSFIVTRGPEYLTQLRKVKIGDEATTLTFKLKRWVDPAKLGWWSGDHHIHAAGCAHYRDPTQGVNPLSMAKHCQGEDLKVGCTLTWGPCFDFQKQFFSGKVDAVSKPPYIIRYDIEVSGFGSAQSGHLCLLRLKNQMYPGGKSKHHWPTLGLNTLRWAKKQGAVCGPAHSGFGLAVPGTKLPNYRVPRFNGIGANEYIVDVTHMVDGPDDKKVPAVDFISTVDTPYVWELNIWYHTLNCGFRTRISGESDFPCIYGTRVGVGRSYVKQDGKLNFDSWCEGIRNGRSYVSDGFSHLMEFKVGDVAVGEKGSVLKLEKPGSVKVTARVSALMGEKPTGIRNRPYTQKPYWHIERARIGDSRKVPVEVVVNGFAVARKEIVADGTARDITFDVEIKKSSWVAIRILPSSHTNPVFVLVGDKPIRADRKSAEWCLKSVDQCWSQKKRFYRGNEQKEARMAYDHARAVYRKILKECGD